MRLPLLVAGTLWATSALAQLADPQDSSSRPILDQREIMLQPYKARGNETFYPARAQQLGREGQAVLLCDIGADQSLSCTAESEAPTGFGFGEAAVRLFDEMRVQPLTKHGEPVSGRRVRITFNFKLH